MKAGFAERDITPAPGVTLSGFGYSGRPSDAIRDRLSARVLALIKPDGTSLALVSTDLLAMSDEQITLIKQDLDKDNCIPFINNSHTHSGPALGEFGTEEPPDGQYVDELIAAITDGVRQAIDSAVPARVLSGTAQAVAGINRRPRLEPNPSGPYDPSVTVLRVVDDDDRPVACWFTLAAHPTTLDGSAISADWPGVASAASSSAQGCPALFAQGCAGDVMPIQQDPEIVGETAAGGVRAAWDAAVEIGADGWTSSTAERSLPTERPPRPDERVPTLRVQAVRLGDLTLVALNAEPFVRIGEMARRHCPTPLLAVIGYTNGCLGYLPDDEAFREPAGSRGYELEGGPVFFRTPPLSRESVSTAESAIADVLADLR